MSSPKHRFLKKINTMSSRSRPFRVAILGQNGVGKTALTVRFCTRRYIGDYDPTLERVYSCQRPIKNSLVDFEVWDTAGVNQNSRLKEQVRWADAIILVYDVTDRCSFDECSRLKFLVNSYSRRNRWRAPSDPTSDSTGGLPVALVGNKSDREVDRMVQPEEGRTRSVQLRCIQFHELTVREEVDEVIGVFEDLYAACRVQKLRLPLSPSKNSLMEEKLTSPMSSSDDDMEGAAAGAGVDGRRLRRETLPSQTPIATQGGSRATRRRQAVFTMC